MNNQSRKVTLFSAWMIGAQERSRLVRTMTTSRTCRNNWTRKLPLERAELQSFDFGELSTMLKQLPTS